MKFLIMLLLVLFSLIMSKPKKNLFSNEETLGDIKKNLLECLINDKRSSEKLKTYANENLGTPASESLRLYTFINNERDRFVIRTCRKSAFATTFIKSSVSKSDTTQKENNLRKNK